ncbi:MAG: phosphodiester glycosidase family protein [Sulfitobacter sp.]|uniref:phosphodiester glycosidase family protein n=1 Tax=unclassified Sulfitobacter TaxID=196795 RepID=UPI001110F6AF|nr:phosphodiester glycosidase family protein [Sulfitobacter sp. BSw21498]
MKRFWAALGFMGWAAAPVHAETCETLTFNGTGYTICDVDLTQDRLELFLYDPDGKPHGYFNTLNTALKKQGQQLGFAMNAGMYHDDRAPVGYYLENGKEHQKVISSDGPGNFGLLPNGVLCLRDGRADVIETKAFVRKAPDCRSATQSGPMLVIDGKLHPRFLKDGTSRYIRNGVGTSADGKRAVFAISNETVNFYDFALLFRDHLKLPNALYFDGNISRLRAPDLGRNDLGFSPLGPIIGVVKPDAP